MHKFCWQPLSGRAVDDRASPRRRSGSVCHQLSRSLPISAHATVIQIASLLSSRSGRPDLDDVDRRNRSTLLPIMRGDPIDTAYLYRASVHESDVAALNGTGSTSISPRYVPAFSEGRCK
jgi:hypothetical protein